jgi:hypothetical protein
MLLPAQVIAYCDPLATCLKNSYGWFGLDAPGESGTLASYFDAFRVATLGDGISEYGLGSPAFQNLVLSAINSAVRQAGYDVFFQGLKSLITALNTNVQNNLPAGWVFGGNGNSGQAFDFALQRMNGISANAPATPTAGTLAAVNQPGGAMPSFTSGNAPYLCHSLVRQYDYMESLPSADATRVAISAAYNGYSYTISGTVPAGVYKVRIYRSFVSGADHIYYWAMDVAVTPGGAYPVIYVLAPDRLLRTDVRPPSWMSCLMASEFAAIFALAFATAQKSTSQAGVVSAPIFSSVGMLSPINVALPSANLGTGIAANGFMGIGNSLASVVLDTATITAANTATHVQGSIQTANAPGSNIQGYAGAAGLQVRVVNALTGGTLTSVTISYSYLAAATGQTVESGTLTSGACTGTAEGSTCAFTLPAGELVLAAHVTGVACSATGGEVIIEGLSTGRSY